MKIGPAQAVPVVFMAQASQLRYRRFIHSGTPTDYLRRTRMSKGDCEGRGVNQALLRHLGCSKIVAGRSWSFADRRIPKLELGNEERAIMKVVE
jgi:hypothetical protein